MRKKISVGQHITASKGYKPEILDHEDKAFIGMVLDTTWVEYGTGCWIDGGFAGELETEMVYAVWEAYHGPVPEGYIVQNVCSEYRLCYNPNCMETTEAFPGETDES